MLTRSLSVLFASPAVLGIATTAGQSETAWSVRHGNGSIWAEASSLTHGSTLSIQCDEGNRSIALVLEPPASWNGDAGFKMKILVDEKAFPVIVDGTDDGVVLSNLPNDAVGTSLALRRAMKAGKEMVIEGPPAAGIPLKQRSFSLAGASAAIGRIESACPGVR